MCGYNYEFTDTYGGEANYSWVKRGTVKAKSFNHAWRLIKKKLDVAGEPTKKVMDTGDMVRHDFRKACWCVFITWSEDNNEE